ncbi:MAG: SIS domain-containing protein [Candidatus ainarchaeum sp.]|nr:SIS domain-containing protein [Candidatus ainarchaeum sp.]
MNVPDLNSYVKMLKQCLDAIDEEDVASLANLLLETNARGGTIYVFGNGDSATNAVHFAADLSKGTIVPGKKRLRIICLNENVPLMTAWGNDTSYDMIFKEQLENLLRPGDLAIGISTSGNSPNVLRAIEYANGAGAHTAGLAAFKGGKLASTAKHCIIAKTDNVEIAEDVHFVIGHLLKIHIVRKQMGEA